MKANARFVKALMLFVVVVLLGGGVAFAEKNIQLFEEKSGAEVPAGGAAIVGKSIISPDEVVREMLRNLALKGAKTPNEDFITCVNYLAVRMEVASRKITPKESSVKEYLEKIMKDRGVKEATPALKFEAETAAIGYALLLEEDKEKSSWTAPDSVNAWIRSYIEKSGALKTDVYKLPEGTAAAWRGQPIPGADVARVMWLLNKRYQLQAAMDTLVERKLAVSSEEAAAVKDEDLKAHFDKNREKFNGHMIRVSRIFVRFRPEIADKKEAKDQALTKIKKIETAILDEGGSFVNLAADNSDAASRNNFGDEGWITRNSPGFSKTFIEAAFKLKNVTELSEPVVGDDGVDLIKLDASRELPNTTWENCRERVLESLLKEKHAGDLNKWLDELKTKFAIGRNPGAAFKMN